MSRPVVIARLAPPDYRVKSGLPVVSVGCNNGDPPTARPSTVTRLNRFTGPPNIEVAGQPVEGRSGGGLFSPEGYVIGICNAADPDYREGYFGAVASVYDELDRGRMAFVYRKPAGRAIGPTKTPLSVANVGVTPPAAPGAPAVAGVAPSGLGDSLPDFGRSDGANPDPARQPAGSEPDEHSLPLAGAAGQAPANSQASPSRFLGPLSGSSTGHAIADGQASPGEPAAVSGSPIGAHGGVLVIRLSDVSAEFLEQLAVEKRRQEQQQAKQLADLRPRRKLLEWSAADRSLADGRGDRPSQLTRTSLEQRRSE